ncbi:YbaY family lipoprotein [Vibrio sp. CAU 1672]|nr:YbaY family lipoprotein [Vibrio sp. CAU 1672]MDF2153605.1 YbaY family lipoprotein [Vibrio sp. CAU 1672]
MQQAETQQALRPDAAAATGESVSEPVMTDSITGTVAYRERMALPPQAVVTVTLEDVSLADAPSVVLAEQSIDAEGQQIPFAFELEYDSNQIKPNHRYSLRARIEADGQLMFITDAHVGVITDELETKQADLILIRVK